MASLQYYSCMLLTTNHKTPKISSASARRFHVSCGVDRRNMLLGLGGLYGAAANLKALADPIQLQDLKSCGIHDPSEMPPHENCCPPFSNAIKDYVLPPRGQMRVRKAAQNVGHEFVDKYKEAVRRMRVLDTSYPDDPRGFMQQANVHCAYCNEFFTNHSNIPIAIHASWLFFPWHRWFLYFHERILASLINDPAFAVPFWNWDNPEGMHLPPIYDEPCSPLSDAHRDERHRGAAFVDLQYFRGKPDPTDNVRLVNNNLITMYKVMTSGFSHPEDFMGQSYRDGDPPPSYTRQGSLEAGPHDSVHLWGGNPCDPNREDLGAFYSAGRDPAFYSHHSNIDRLWTIWNQGNQIQITDPDYLNASFLFYDENKELVRVKVADALDNARMGYEYEVVDTPWRDFRPPKRPAGLRIEDISKGAKSAFPLTLDKTVKVLVRKQNPGKVKEKLVLEGVTIDGDDFVKFDVYVNLNAEEDEPKDAYMAEYAGTFSTLRHGGGHRSHKGGGGSISFNLTELYEDININDGDDEVVVTIVPRSSGRLVTIGGIKIDKI